MKQKLECVFATVLGVSFLAGVGSIGYGVWLAVADGPLRWVAAGFAICVMCIASITLLSEALV